MVIIRFYSNLIDVPAILKIKRSTLKSITKSKMSHIGHPRDRFKLGVLQNLPK